MASQQASCTRLCNGLQRLIARVSAVACGTASFDRAKETAKDCILHMLKPVAFVVLNPKEAMG
jgi:hypothetical protein